MSLFPPPQIHIALDDTLGAAFLGHVVTTLLYGITSLQAYVYFRDNQRDSTPFKVSVAGLWILDTIHVALITGAMYWYCITSFSNLLAIQRPIWPIPTMIVVSTISNTIIRGFFCVRLFRLGRIWWLPAIIVAMSAFIFVDAGIFVVKLFHVNSYTRIQDFSWGLYAGLSVEAAVDMIVAISQCVMLRKFETGIRSTDSAIRVLMTYAINTGLLTSLCAIGAVVSFAVAPRKFIYFAFYFVLSKLYVNSLLATLNARESLLGTGARRRRGRHPEKPYQGHTTPATTAELPTTGLGARGLGHGVEFTSVISAVPFHAGDTTVETAQTKIEGSASDDHDHDHGPDRSHSYSV